MVRPVIAALAKAQSEITNPESSPLDNGASRNWFLPNSGGHYSDARHSRNCRVLSNRFSRYIACCDRKIERYYGNESGFVHASGDPSTAQTFGRYSQAHRSQIDDFRPNGSGDVRRLKGSGGCRLRIGDWRVIFIEDVRSITVIAVGNRREIYD